MSHLLTEILEALAAKTAEVEALKKEAGKYAILTGLTERELAECRKALAEKEAERVLAIEKYHAEIKRGRLACDDFVKLETDRLLKVNAELRETIGRYSDERQSVRDMLLKELDGMRDRDLSLYQQVAKLANLRHWAERACERYRAALEKIIGYTDGEYSDRAAARFVAQEAPSSPSPEKPAVQEEK